MVRFPFSQVWEKGLGDVELCSSRRVGRLCPNQPDCCYTCSCSFSRGRFALLDRTLLVFSPGLAPALVLLPGQVVQVTTIGSSTLSTYEVSRQVVLYQQVGFTTGTMTELTGVVGRDDDDRRRCRNCNQGIGNGSEGCNPGNSRPRGGSNDEGDRRRGRNR